MALSRALVGWNPSVLTALPVALHMLHPSAPPGTARSSTRSGILPFLSTVAILPVANLRLVRLVRFVHSVGFRSVLFGGLVRPENQCPEVAKPIRAR